MNLLALATAAAMLPGATGKPLFPGVNRTGRDIAEERFHSGKRPAGGYVEPACAGNGCHLPGSHRRGAGAAFLNMHEENVTCLACHGKDSGKRWTLSARGPDGGERLSYRKEEGQGSPHDALAAAATCERCHSEDGKERLAAAGWKKVPQGFVSPIPLRMLREGNRKWVPDDVR